MSIVLNTALKPFESLFNKKGLIEVCFNEPASCWLEMDDGTWKREKTPTINAAVMGDLVSALATLSGQKFDAHHPIFAGKIPWKGRTLRIQAVRGSMVEGGFSITIRVGQSTLYPIEGYMSEKEAHHLKWCINAGKTLMVNGGTGSGKTTFMNSLITHIPIDERLITVEDTRELIVPHPNAVHLLKAKTGTDIASLNYADFINSITRMRPDRILFGEIDTDNTMPFLNLSNSGHGGGLSTIHASNADEAFDRLCLNAALGGVKGDKKDIKEYALNAIDGFVGITKTIENGKRCFRAKLELLK